jgi:hypothetical protein
MRDAVTRTAIDGVEHIVISSKTLPDDVVMNGGLYPADEIAASFASLERTLAPVEHPHDAQGNFLSANDPTALHNFYAGAFNANVRQENGRIVIDKVVNVQEALKTDRGKRLLGRLEELENSADPRPVHTSVGVFLEIEETDGPQVNAQGAKYTWVARNMVFDHDAILLDSVGAAQPHQGVGMAVNAGGDEIEVRRSALDLTEPASAPAELSHGEIREALSTALDQPPFQGGWVQDVIGDKVIFMVDDTHFSAAFRMDGKRAIIVDIPLPVDRDVTYTPQTNQEGDAMRDLIVNALKAAGVETKDLTDEQLQAAYAEQLTANAKSKPDDTAALADVVAQLTAVNEKLTGLETKLNQHDDDELTQLATVVGNSEKYPGLSADAAKTLGVDTLKTMAANCATAHGIPLTVVNGGKSDDFEAFDAPE